MSEKKVYSTKLYRAIGLMSGTSLDGVDAALIETDGVDHVQVLGFVSAPYEEAERAEIRRAFGLSDRADPLVQRAEALVTQKHIAALEQAGWQADVIGFHGQTICHAPDEGVSIQIGDARAMADALGIDVVHDFRSADVAAGGQGAPLAPLYHRARVKAAGAAVAQPCAVFNIGGVANVTYIDGEDILAFDTGPGNALMDDWVKLRTGAPYDEGGALAARGQVVEAMLERWLAHPYFTAQPPKSLDRNEWDIADFGQLAQGMDGVNTEDGAATLLEFTVRTIAGATRFVPAEPKAWYVCGGGRHNTALMQALAERLSGDVHDVSALGWNGDATEAECFAYLAVRSLLGKPLSLPSTTGVKAPMSGGGLAKAP